MSISEQTGPGVPEQPRVARRARLRYDETRESHVLLMPERVVMLSETAAEILGLCDGARTLPELLDELRQRYPEGDMEGDVMEFLEEAVRRQWLEAPSSS